MGIEPPLPLNIEEILTSPCPFWREKRVVETHLLTLIPATVNGRPFTLNYLSELILAPKNGEHATKYRYYWDDTKKQEGEKLIERSYWVLMTRDVVPGTRNRTYTDGKMNLEGFAKSIPLLSKGEMPTLLEAATSILMEYVRTGRRLYGDEPWTFTRCQEVLNNHRCYVGNFSFDGLDLRIINDGAFSDSSGLAFCWKLGSSSMEPLTIEESAD